jgi:hypothetical protein
MCQMLLKLNFNCIRIKLFDALLKIFGILQTLFAKNVTPVFLCRYQFYFEFAKQIFLCLFVCPLSSYIISRTI